MNFIYRRAENTLRKAGVWERAWNSVEDHAPLWHEFPLLVHTEKTILASMTVMDRLGIDLRMVMALHDIEKIHFFLLYCKQPDLPDRLTYPRHEQQSARRAQVNGFDAKTVFLIRWHGLSYSGIKPENLITKYGQDPDLLSRLILTWACDAFGKGWTPNQCQQRPALVDFIHQIASLTQVPDKILPVCEKLILNGQPI